MKLVHYISCLLVVLCCLSQTSAGSLKTKRFLILDILTPQFLIGDCIKCRCKENCLGDGDGEGALAFVEKAACEPFYAVIECDGDIEGDRCPSGHCSGHSDCIQVDGVGRACVCLSGYTGRNCDVPVNTATQTTVPSTTPTSTTTTTTTTTTTSTTPAPVQDFCSGYPCGIHGQCNNDVNGYTCTCNPGWTGQNCQTDISPCKSSPCQNGGTCLDVGNSFLCLCADGWAGTMCEKDSTPSCDHTCVLAPVANVQSVTNNASSTCTDSTKTSNEAIPMTCCGLGRTDTWIRGIQVMSLCSTIPAYTPVASFDKGVAVNDTAGVLLQCDGNGFKFIRQVCNNTTHIVEVDGTSGMNPTSFFVIY